MEGRPIEYHRCELRSVESVITVISSVVSFVAIWLIDRYILSGRTPLKINAFFRSVILAVLYLLITLLIYKLLHLALFPAGVIDQTFGNG